MKLKIEFYNPFYFPIRKKNRNRLARFPKDLSLVFGAYIQFERFFFSIPPTGFHDGLIRWPKTKIEGDYIIGVNFKFMWWWLSISLYRPKP